MAKKKSKAPTSVSVKKTPEFLAKTPKAKSVPLKKDKDGFYVGSHRWRSNSYKTINSIPKKIIEFAESTM